MGVGSKAFCYKRDRVSRMMERGVGQPRFEDSSNRRDAEYAEVRGDTLRFSVCFASLR